MLRPSPKRSLFVVVAVLGVIGAVVACGEGTGAGTGGNGGGGGGVGEACSLPNEGCTCTGGEAACGYKLTGDDDFIWCAEGKRQCNAGRWGACRPTGTVSVQSRTLLLASVSPPPSAGGVTTKALGTPADCSSFGDGGLNPCDPNCRVTSDTPAGIDAGPGFRLADGGLVATTAQCGDSVVQAGEECDDGNVTAGDGCSGGCFIEIGFQCPTPGAPCIPATCGNGTIEGAERCDDGNVRPYDGCSSTCQREVSCPTGECVAVCGDGIKFPAEACDDGNTTNGDGCSSTCTVESGATCTTVTSGLAPSVNVPVIYRDMRPSTSLDFQPAPGFSAGVRPGIVQPLLAADRKPVFLSSQTTVQNAASFFQWYHDDPINQTIIGSLTLTRQPDTSYRFSSNNFFPIDGLGWGNYAATGRNFHFTSELRYPFTFNGGEVLDFNGDDDVFVFINGRLAVDLGGVHGPAPGSVTLSPVTALALGLVAGRTYEVSVFQAERNTTGSNYTLTLRGFERAVSSCVFPTSTTFVRDFQAVCPTGHGVHWQLFRWRAAVPTASTIDFRAATANTLAELPAGPAAAPATVGIGTANPTNSPAAATPAWVTETSGLGDPIPVSQSLRDEGATSSKRWLRVYMTFNAGAGGSPRLDEWQQLYDCVSNE